MGTLVGGDFFHYEHGGTSFEEVIPADFGVDFSEEIVCFCKRPV